MRCLIVDDHPLTRDGTASALREVAPSADVIDAGSLAQAMDLLEREPAVDLVLLDLELGDSQGIETLRSLKDFCERIGVDARCVVMSGNGDPSLVREVVEHYGTGFILKATERRIFTQAIALTIAGGVYIPEVVLRHLDAGVRARVPAGASARPVQLTPRETEVAALLVHGYTYKRIARELAHRDGKPVSDHTIRAHVGNIAWKLGVTENAKSGVMAEIARRGLTFPLQPQPA